MNLVTLTLIEMLGSLIQNSIFFALLAVPWIFIFKKSKHKSKHKGLKKLILINLLSLPLIFALITLLAYWPHFFRDLRLSLIGFDFHGLSDAERVQNVAPELQDFATELYQTGMGIGWTLQAIIGMVMVFPYPTLAVGLKTLTQFLVKQTFRAI